MTVYRSGTSAIQHRRGFSARTTIRRNDHAFTRPRDEARIIGKVPVPTEPGKPADTRCFPIQNIELTGLGTSLSYENSLRLAADWLQKKGRGSLFELTPKAARIYLAERPQQLNSRNNTLAQVQKIIACQNARNAFSTELASAAGLRAHELLTLLPATERPMNDRPADPQKIRVRLGDIDQAKQIVSQELGHFRPDITDTYLR